MSEMTHDEWSQMLHRHYSSLGGRTESREMEHPHQRAWDEYFTNSFNFHMRKHIDAMNKATKASVEAHNKLVKGVDGLKDNCLKAFKKLAEENLRLTKEVDLLKDIINREADNVRHRNVIEMPPPAFLRK